MHLGTSVRADSAPARSISVAWCKKHEVPIEKIYTKVLLEKFGVRVDARGRVAWLHKPSALGLSGVLCAAVVHGDGLELRLLSSQHMVHAKSINRTGVPCVKQGGLASSKRVEARLQVTVQAVACRRRNRSARGYRWRGGRTAGRSVQ